MLHNKIFQLPSCAIDKLSYVFFIIYNVILQGGSSSELSMTAYMTLALMTLKNEMPIPEIQQRVLTI